MKEVILTQEDKNNGVCLVDIGADVTSYSIFKEGSIVRSGVIRIGSDNVTQEVAHVFETSFKEAERLKEIYEVAKSSTLKEETFITFGQATNKEKHQLSSLQLSEVIEKVHLEFLSLLRDKLKQYTQPSK